MLLFHVGGFLIIYGLMRLQALLPLNPAEQSAVAPDLSFNTAISFLTNTNWQNYGGESTLSYLVQMLGLTHQKDRKSTRLNSSHITNSHAVFCLKKRTPYRDDDGPAECSAYARD